METIKEATSKAIAFAQEALGLERTLNLQLEEIESAKEGPKDVWRITLSMPDISTADPLAAFIQRRAYKTFTVDRATGEVLSMKIRELSRA